MLLLYFIRVLLLSMCFLTIFSVTARAAAPEVWLAALPNAAQGYVAIFEEPDAWSIALGRTSVFQVHDGLLPQLSEARLKRLLDLLRGRNIQLALVVQILPVTLGCMRTEAFAADATVFDQIDRIHRLGGSIRYILFDEPIWYGGGADRLPGCTLSVQQIGERAASRAIRIKKVFPSTEFVDIEPSDVRADRLASFLDAFATHSGDKINYVHVDILWDHDWVADLKSWHSTLAKRSIGLGLIIDGGAYAGGDSKWEADASSREHRVLSITDGQTNIRVIYESWKTFPSRYLPETQLGTLSHLIAHAPW